LVGEANLRMMDVIEPPVGSARVARC